MKEKIRGRGGAMACAFTACALCVAMAVLIISGHYLLPAIWLLTGGAVIFISDSAIKRKFYEGMWTHTLCAAGEGLLVTFACLIEKYTVAWFMLLVLAGFIGGVLVKSIASDRDHNSPIWFVFGFACMPLAVAAAITRKSAPEGRGRTAGRVSALVGNPVFTRIEPWLYLLPFLAGLAVFTLYPVINVAFLSFKDGYSYLTREFAGWSLNNYKDVITDKYFVQALRNTMVYVLCVVPISTAIAVVVAYLLNQKLRGSAIFQTAFFMPMVTSITAVGLAWKLMYNKNFGVINYFLSLFGVNAVNWLDNPDWRVCVMTLVIFGIWNILPFTIILLLSGLQNIDNQYYTAAKIDGAKSGRIFFRITVPLLAPTIFLVCIVNTISSFKVFSELYPLFKGNPGPYNNLYTVVYYIRYAMMNNREYGIAAAAAIILFLFILCFTMIQLFVQKRMAKRTM